MIISATEYKNKVRGCWLGKNIGGTLGAPFECIRGVFDLTGYTQDLKDGALPNDDLDLQLVWLNAAEKYGRGVDAKILGEYWLSYIVGNWSEYGAGKNNLSKSILPPLSGWYNNHNRDSCGAFIRSEVWACLAPGHPEIAVKYAFEDATVDHSDEGVYAEIFCAAMQSAAFSECDKNTLIQIGLSYIPTDCGIALAVNTAMECYQSGMDWKGARKKILQTVPGAFGMYRGYEDREVEEDVPVGKLGYDAPSNIGIMIIGWLYGEDDFGKSLCIAAGCCEDGDCTAATLGAIMGIIMGADALPEQWLKPIGDGIKTISLDLTNNAISIPTTITELSRRVCALMPVFMGKYCDTMNEGGTVISLGEANELYDTKARVGIFNSVYFRDKLKTQPFGIYMENVLFQITLSARSGINLKDCEEMKFEIDLVNNIKKQQWLHFRWIMPADWNVSTGREFSINLDQAHGGYATAKAEVVLYPGEIAHASYDIVLEISSVGRLSKMYVPITLLNNPQILR